MKKSIMLGLIFCFCLSFVPMASAQKAPGKKTIDLKEMAKMAELMKKYRNLFPDQASLDRFVRLQKSLANK